MTISLEDKPKKKPRDPRVFGAIAIAVGVFSALMLLFNGMAALIFGAVGLFMGGYGTSICNRQRYQYGNVPMVMACIGILLSMIAFMVGLAHL